MPLLPWIVALSALLLLSVVLLAWALKSRSTGRPHRQGDLPTDWALGPRPVFSVDERRVYRLLREAFPHHVVLAKLPLVRFCQPTDPSTVRYWFDLLGAYHVTFAICSPNGRVLAAVDLDTDRMLSRRVAQIKQSVLSACRVRFLRCPVDQPPSIAELQLLVPSGAATLRGPHPAPAPHAHAPTRDALGHPVNGRRGERVPLWHDSAVFQDSFFGPDSRSGFGNSEFSASVAPLPRAAPSSASRLPATDDRPDALTGVDTSEWHGDRAADSISPRVDRRSG